MLDTIAALDLVDAVYLMSVFADHPRPIDQYIDYFGGGAGDIDAGGADHIDEN